MTKPAYPPGSFNAHWFNLFNAVSFQIMMGAPIIVFAKSLGASSTVLGIIAAFTPLMTVFQLPAARFLDRYGFREFVMMGWSLRTIFIFVVALVPLLAFMDNNSKMAVLLASLFIFNLLRGISSAAWMPWIAALIPEEGRGRFLSLDQLFMYGGSLISLLVSAVVMTGQVDPWEYSLVFLISAIGATLSLTFIRRIPEATATESVKKGSQPVPWRAIIKYPPFKELLIFNLVYMAVIGSLGVFTVEFLRDAPGFDVATVLVLSAFSFVGALVALPFCGAIIDRTGSKPLMRRATILFGAVIAGWALLAGKAIPCTLWIVALLNFFSGIASAIFNLANLRITMATMPEMGRNHFFALFTVVTSLGLGAAPVVWGVTLDALGTYEFVAGFFTWKRHSIYFAALFVLNLFAFALIYRLIESPGAGKLEPSVIYGRLKRTPRIWHR
jgi:MFS family permease